MWTDDSVRRSGELSSLEDLGLTRVECQELAIWGCRLDRSELPTRRTWVPFRIQKVEGDPVLDHLFNINQNSLFIAQS